MENERTFGNWDPWGHGEPLSHLDCQSLRISGAWDAIFFKNICFRAQGPGFTGLLRGFVIFVTCLSVLLKQITKTIASTIRLSP